MSLNQKTAKGVVWSLISFGGGKLLTFISTVILARLLLPQSFGQVAIALLVISYLDAVGDLGAAAALIYQRDDIERAASIAAMISVVMGFVLAGALLLAAGFIGDYFKEPQVVPMLQVLSINFIIQSLGNVHDALLQKELQFRKRILPDFTRTFAKGGGAVVLALLGFGAWSLVWGQVFGTIVATLALWVAKPWRPQLIWDSKLGKAMLHYGLQIIMVEILAVVWTTADYIIVGRFLGSTDLGLYQQAFRITDLLIMNIVFVAGRVLFPSFAKLSKSEEDLRSGFLSSQRYTSIITLSLSIGLCAVASLFVPVVFGSKWWAMIPALQILALRAGISAISFNSGNVLKAIGRPGLVNLQMAVKLIVMIPVLLYAVQYGFIGVAVGQVFVTFVGMIIDYATIIRIINIKLTDILRQIVPYFVAASIMGIVTWVAVGVMPRQYLLFDLIGSIILGTALFSMMMWFIDRPLVELLLSAGRKLIRSSLSKTAVSAQN